LSGSPALGSRGVAQSRPSADDADQEFMNADTDHDGVWGCPLASQLITRATAGRECLPSRNTCLGVVWCGVVWPILTGKISRAEWREWARQKREMMQRFNSEKEALVADNKRLRASMDPSVRSVSPNHPSDLHPSSVALSWC
jgi:hypothetical protein